jgi:membrane protease YdiL (CAAX protease family)
MPFAGRLLALLAAILGFATLVAPGVWWALDAATGHTQRFSFPRVYDRVLEVAAAVALIRWRHWLGFSSWRDVGLGAPERRRDVWVGFAVALAGMIALVGAMHWAGALRFFWRYPSFEKGVQKALLGTVAAILIGPGEEILFRGILLGGLMQHLRRGAAVAWTTAIYAVVHFLRGGKQVGEVSMWSGVERLASAFAPLADWAILPGLAGFVLLGLVLAHARLGSGALYLPIGLHIGWVFTLRAGRVIMDFPLQPGLFWGERRPPIVSGIAGWAAIAATFLVLAWVLRRRERSRRAASLIS